MTRFILVRHGQSEANKSVIFAGHTDAPLSELGFTQAEKTAEYLLNNYKIDVAYASDLKRAFFTGKTIADKYNLDIIKNKNFREIYAGLWEGMYILDIKEKFNKEYTIWMEDIGNAHPNEGEAVKKLQERVLRELKEIAKKENGKTVLIATHATPIRALTCFLKGYPLSEMKNVPWVANSSVTIVDFDGGEFKLITEGYNEHLEGMISFPSKNI